MPEKNLVDLDISIKFEIVGDDIETNLKTVGVLNGQSIDAMTDEEWETVPENVKQVLALCSAVAQATAGTLKMTMSDEPETAAAV